MTGQPDYLAAELRSCQPQLSLRSSSQELLTVPHCKTVLWRVYTLQPVGPTGCNNRLAQAVGCNVYTMQHVVPTGWLTVYTLQPVVQPERHAHANPTMTCSIVAASHCRKMKCFYLKAIQMTSVGCVRRNMPSNIQRLLYTDENSNSHDCFPCCKSRTTFPIVYVVRFP